MAVKIGNKWVGDGYPCFVVAEIGINHNGSLEITKKLIGAAVEAGADAVKFQKRTVEIVYTAEELAKPRESPFGTTNGDLKYALEFSMKEYDTIDLFCQEKGIMWFASSWDGLSAHFINGFNVPCHKIASPCLTHIDLLKRVRYNGKPVILSTGGSTIEQIEKAVEFLGREDLILLHCVADYPCDDNEVNLRVIRTLRAAFLGVPIGYSGHEIGILPSVMAVAMGACLVERHITLDKNMPGSDHKASLEPEEFKQMVAQIRRLEVVMGSGIKRVLPSEIPVMEKLRRKIDF